MFRPKTIAGQINGMNGMFLPEEVQVAWLFPPRPRTTMPAMPLGQSMVSSVLFSSNLSAREVALTASNQT